MTTEPILEKRGPAAIRWLRRIVVILAGFTVLLIGAAFLVLPGPGIPIVIVGLAILATEFVWARHALLKLKQGAMSLRDLILGPKKDAPKSP